ncbi:MAG: hypothetical protein AAB415_03500 [Patescibacteria group bacterium]
MKYWSHYLERWRQEPEATRQRRALVIAFGLTLILFVLWLGSFRFSASLDSPSLLEARRASLRITPDPALTAPTSTATSLTEIVARIKAGWRTVTQ